LTHEKYLSAKGEFSDLTVSAGETIRTPSSATGGGFKAYQITELLIVAQRRSDFRWLQWRDASRRLLRKGLARMATTSGTSIEAARLVSA
jgi:hypothetical protein